MNFTQNKIAFLFEGIGKKSRAEIQEFNQVNHNILDSYIRRANAFLGVRLDKYLKGNLEEGESEGGNEGEFLEWITLYMCDCVIYKELVKQDIRPTVFAGYSMGLITEMVCAQSISFETGLALLKEIYEYPRRTKRKNESMGGIIGLKLEQVQEIIEDIDLEEFVQIASENNELCIIISGCTNAVNMVMKVAEERDAIKVTKLETSYAFHSDFAREGMEKMSALVDEVEVADAKVPIISVFSGQMMQHSEDLRKELIRNLYTSMKWKQAILELDRLGIYSFIEVGLNGDLTQISKAIQIKGKCSLYTELVDSNTKSDNVRGV